MGTWFSLRNLQPTKIKMPCYDPETHERPKRLEAKVHRLTAMLCYLCGKTEATNPAIIADNRELAEWWRNHKAQDKRVAAVREKRRVGGWQSLTADEQRIASFDDDISLG